MISFQNLIVFNRDNDLPVFLQISNGMANLIKTGILAKGLRLPGTRALSESLNVHRKTVVAAYEELTSQGWIEVIPSKGTFVSSNLPIVSPKHLEDGQSWEEDRKRAGFDFYRKPGLKRADHPLPEPLTLDEGVPDVRIAPVQEILRTYKSIVSRGYNRKYLSYGSAFGDGLLREVLAGYLQETRGMNVTAANVLIVRGTQMSMYLASQLTLKPGDKAIVGNSNYIAANMTLEETGASLIRVPVDEQGIDTRAIEAACQKEAIKAVYVTSHHHHPTTVTLSAERRIHLVQLAEQYGFAILEDDYDYDFHYENAPLLPLASADHNRHVVYMGAFCKIVAPAYRIGYLVAAEDFVEEASYLRRIIDRQGDSVLERALAQMIQQGDFQRHSKKALKLYTERRDHFCELLRRELGEYLSFTPPEGGMAVWVALRPDVSWEVVTQHCLKHNLHIPDWKNYDQQGLKHNCIRMGFASLNFEEQTRVVEILKKAMDLASNQQRSQRLMLA